MTGKEKIWLQPQLQTGGAKIATLIRQTVHGSHGRPGLAIYASKQPVAVIIATHSACRIFSLREDGRQFIDDEAIRREITTFASEAIAR